MELIIREINRSLIMNLGGRDRRTTQSGSTKWSAQKALGDSRLWYLDDILTFYNEYNQAIISPCHDFEDNRVICLGTHSNCVKLLIGDGAAWTSNNNGNSSCLQR